jgi:GNAT superfamily N-acetyltransferase
MQARVHLRPASAGECPALSDLCLRSKGHWGYDTAFLEACRAELRIHQGDLGDFLRVAEVEGVPAGVAQLGHDCADWTVEKLFVDPPFIGCGVGAVLMGWLVETARANGATRLVIEADPGAVSFYRRFGAVDDGMVASGSITGRFIPRLVLPLAATGS